MSQTVELPPEMDPESEPVKYLAQIKRRASKNFKWTRKHSLEEGVDLAFFLLVWGRIEEALSVATFLAQKPFTGHEIWYLTETANILAARIHRERGDAATAARFLKRIHEVGYVETRLDETTFERARDSIEGNRGYMKGQIAWRRILCQELMFAIEMLRESGRPNAQYERELEQLLSQLRQDLKVKESVPQTAAVRRKPARRVGVKSLWKRIRNSLSTLAPPVAESLQEGASASSISAAEADMAVDLPKDVRDHFTTVNGQSSPLGLISGYWLLPIEQVVEEWRVWKDLLDSGEFENNRSNPDHGVRDDWWHPAWIPIASNGAGDFFCVDLKPAKGGKKGQVVQLLHDDSPRNLAANSLRDWLQEFADALDAGEYTVSSDGLDPAT